MFVKQLLTFSLLGFTLVCHGELAQNDTGREIVKKELSSPLDARISGQHQGEALVRAKQLRCWQRGKLVFAENDVQLRDASVPRFVNESGQHIHLYDYGEALCVYLGE